MFAILLYLAAAPRGFDVGWERSPDGGVEYTIQLDPATLDALRAGQPIASDIRPEAGSVRSFRISVGAEKLRRDAPPPSPPKTTDPSKSFAPKKLPADPGGKPLPANAAGFTDAKQSPVAAPQKTAMGAAGEPPKPWTPLIVTLLGLFTSIGVNVFLGWVALDARRRVRAARAG
jgi:hypothetical protein